jgi:hypothetical protein
LKASRFRHPEQQLKKRPDQIDMPESAMDNQSDLKYFDSFVQSDMLVETIRALKLKAILNLLDIPGGKDNHKEKKLLQKWADEYVLEDDEDNIYNKIMEHLKPGSRWGAKENKFYHDSTVKSWDRQRDALLKYLKQDRAFQSERARGMVKQPVYGSKARPGEAEEQKKGTGP